MHRAVKISIQGKTDGDKCVCMQIKGQWKRFLSCQASQGDVTPQDEKLACMGIGELN